MVDNCKITFNNVQLPSDSFMPDAKSYRKGVESMLKLSRLQVIFITAGVCMGIYRSTIKYVTERKQFGTSIASFQLIQLKVTEIMSNLQAIMLMCQRAAEMSSNGELTMGHIAMFKAWVTERSRYIAKLGR